MTNATDPFSASLSHFEVPEQMRAFAEKGVSQARDGYAKFKEAAESGHGTMEAVFSTAHKGVSDYSSKMMDFVKSNTSANFDFAHEIFGVKSLSEAMDVWTGFTRRQFETMTGQSKELTELARKIATETAEPIKANASKVFKIAA